MYIPNKTKTSITRDSILNSNLEREKFNTSEIKKTIAKTTLPENNEIFNNCSFCSVS